MPAAGMNVAVQPCEPFEVMLIQLLLRKPGDIEIAAQWSISMTHIVILEGTRLCLASSRLGSNGCNSICCA